MRPDRWNVLVICLDTLRADLVLHQTPDRVETPALDALARESLVCTQAYGEGEPTIPARRALFTGRRSFPWRYQFDTKGCWPNPPGWHKIPPEQTTLAEHLLSHGYKTALISDTYHLFKPTMNFTRGFVTYEFVRGQESDNWRGGRLRPEEIAPFVKGPVDPAQHAVLIQYLLNNRHRRSEEDWTSARVFREAMAWLTENADDRPFFLWIDCFDPHEPWDPPRQYARRYLPDYQGKDLIFPNLFPYDEAEAAWIKALYFGEVTFVDRWVGRLLEHLADLRLLEETVLVLLSDHGTELLDHGRFCKSAPHLYAHNTQVVWFLRYPPRGAGTVEAFVQHHDLVPTLLDLLDLPALPSDGQSLVPVLDGRAAGREYVIVGWGSYASVRDRTWNYIVNYEQPDQDERLYHLPSDPAEQVNVAARFPEVVRQQRQRLAALLGQPLPATLPDRGAPGIAPIRLYLGSRPRPEEAAAGFV